MEIKKDKDGWSFGNYGSLSPNRIFTNDVTFPWEYNPHGVRPWLIYSQYGADALVWAGFEQDALDVAVDLNAMDHLLIDPDETMSFEEAEDAGYVPLGNASELFYLAHVGLVDLNVKKLPLELACAFAEARGAGYENLV